MIINVSSPYDLFMSIMNLVGILSFLMIGGCAFLHLVSKFRRPSPIKVNQDSLVVIIGGCLGLGRSLVFQIAKLYRCKMIIADIRKDLFEEIKAQLKEKYEVSAEFYPVDLNCQQSVEGFTTYVKACVKQRKKNIDLMFYNAGILMTKPAYNASMQEHKLLMNIHYFSPIKVLKDLHQELMGGHFSLTSSLVEILPGCDQWRIQEFIFQVKKQSQAIQIVQGKIIQKKAFQLGYQSFYPMECKQI